MNVIAMTGINTGISNLQHASLQCNLSPGCDPHLWCPWTQPWIRMESPYLYLNASDEQFDARFHGVPVRALPNCPGKDRNWMWLPWSWTGKIVGKFKMVLHFIVLQCIRHYMMFGIIMIDAHCCIIHAWRQGFSGWRFSWLKRHAILKHLYPVVWLAL